MKLYIVKGEQDSDRSVVEYGFGLTETEALQDLREQYRSQGKSTSFWMHTFCHKCTKKTYIPVPESWKSKWGLCWIYWFYHWIAVQYYAITKFHKIYPFHDLDKPIKLTLGIPYCEVNRVHKLKKHHCKNRDPETVDWKEALCDWEASAFSKPQSPLDAIGTWFEYFRDKRKYVIPVLKKYGFLP